MSHYEGEANLTTQSLSIFLVRHPPYRWEEDIQMGILHLFVNLKEYSNGISEEEKSKMEDKSKTVARRHKESTISPGGDSANFSHCPPENIV